MRLYLLLFLLFAFQRSLPAQYLFEGVAPEKYRGEVVCTALPEKACLHAVAFTACGSETGTKHLYLWIFYGDT